MQEEEEARYKRRGEDHCGSREGLTKRRKTKEERNYPQDFAGVFHTFFFGFCYTLIKFHPFYYILRFHSVYILLAGTPR